MRPSVGQPANRREISGKIEEDAYEPASRARVRGGNFGLRGATLTSPCHASRIRHESVPARAMPASGLIDAASPLHGPHRRLHHWSRRERRAVSSSLSMKPRGTCGAARQGRVRLSAGKYARAARPLRHVRPCDDN